MGKDKEPEGVNTYAFKGRKFMEVFLDSDDATAVANAGVDATMKGKKLDGVRVEFLNGKKIDFDDVTIEQKAPLTPNNRN